MEELAIKIEHVSKQYRLGAIGGGTLTADLQSWWARKRGREDPNSRIGARTDIKIGEKFLALDDINLEVKKGEALGIIGHNGAGKSTLLKLLSRVTAPTSGTISYNGRITSMLEVGTGFHGELTGRENIYMNGAILGMTKKEIDAKIEQIIDFSEVRQFIDTPVKRYSSGMYVKLAFSVAAHLDSEIMIMDEVLAVGDMAFQKKCLTKMREAADKEGRTVLYVSHNMNTIRQLCDRCVVLDKGRLIFDGAVEEAVTRYLKESAGGEHKVHYTFTNEDRKGFVPKGMFLRSLDIQQGNTAIFEQGTIVPFRVQFDSEVCYENVSIRFQLYHNGFQLIGSTFLNRSYAVKAGERVIIDFSMDTKNFSPGNYTADLILFMHDGMGNARASDAMKKAISFQIVEGEDSDYRWWIDPFGYVKFDDLAVQTIKEVPSNELDN